jgi:hypothetical protein
VYKYREYQNIDPDEIVKWVINGALKGETQFLVKDDRHFSYQNKDDLVDFITSENEDLYFRINANLSLRQLMNNHSKMMKADSKLFCGYIYF